MKGMASMKPHSWWWNSFTSPRNSKWLSENLEDMDRLVNEMLKLIEEDGDSFAEKAKMYYQRRPQLISHVKDFYRVYRALLQRYDHAIGDLAKNIPSEIQSQCSSNWYECAMEAASASLPLSPARTLEPKANHFKPHWRAAGFDFFLGSGRSSDRSRKGSDESSSESGSESDYSKIMDSYEHSFQLEMRIIGLENELHEARDKLHEYKNGPKEQCENLLNGEVLDLSSTTSSMEMNLPVFANRNFTALQKQIEIFQTDSPDHQVDIKNLMEAMETAAKQFESEISSRDHIIKEYKTWLGAVLNESMQYKSSLKAEGISTIAEDEEVEDERSRLEFRTLEQEQTILELKAMAAHSSKRLLQEKYALEAKLSSLVVSSNAYWAKLQVFEKRVKQLEAEKSKVCAETAKQMNELTQSLDGVKLKVVRLESENEELKAQVSKLVENVRVQDDDLSKADENLRELKAENAKIIRELKAENAKLIREFEESQKASVDLTSRVRELEDEVEKQRVLIMDGAEGKREVIRQLCFSIEHYRMGYQQLCKRLQIQYRRPAIMTT
ncbi:protein NETWORKED 4B-like [Phalaenopsis equestris]|uniref:protein NETWORKED 4B-like n=1 Tax=Phalaenopsis equestris TaxID=78828 RepID=UPI0009E4140E|nr:protein NETWORKED 4B-like [Phalaenopsis equestris]